MPILNFLKEFLLHPSETGAIAPSSTGLARLIVDAAQVRDAQVIVEFGPGTGVFTKQILQQKPVGADFFAMELNQQFAAEVSKRCPEATIYHDNAINAKKYLDKHGHLNCDCIVCGLPWAAFKNDLQDELLDTILDTLKPGGKFVTFAYLQGLLLPAGRAFRMKLSRRFSRVEKTRTVWLNLPPAFVYVAVK